MAIYNHKYTTEWENHITFKDVDATKLVVANCLPPTMTYNSKTFKTCLRADVSTVSESFSDDLHNKLRDCEASMIKSIHYSQIPEDQS